MARGNLRAVFAAGLTSTLSAQDIFTDRVSEADAFRRSLEQFLEPNRTNPPTDILDFRRPRTNVLVYYGVGGIGKTRLSEVLEQQVAEWPYIQTAPRRTTSRIDFAEAASFDLETVVLRIRAGLGQLPIRWTAFDLAFSAYWARAHPGEPLQEFLDRSSGLRGIADRVGLQSQMTDTVVDALGQLGLAGGLAAHGALVLHNVYQRVKRATDQQRLLKDCPAFQPLIDATADNDCLSYLASLMAWDLARVTTPPHLAVVFLDTFEEVQARSSREFENYLHRIAFLMPNVLFVVTGRHRLDWAEQTPPSELDYPGRDRWPTLHRDNRETEPRHHLVGYLPADDCDEYLRSAISVDGRPAIPDDIRARIVSGSDGLPLYLDLSVTHYLAVFGRGETPNPADFGQPLQAVVANLMRDLDPEERRVLRACALLSGFDTELARAAAGDVSDAAVMRLTTRPFVEHDPERVWPYALHGRLRETVRSVDQGMRDAWSPREWSAARARALDHLQSSSAALQGSSDRARLVANFAQATELATETGELPDWIVGVSSHLAEVGLWTVLEPTVDLADVSSPIAAFQVGLQGIRARRQGTLEDSLGLLNRSLQSDKLSPEATAMLALHRANAVRNIGRYDEAMALYRDIARSNSSYQSRAAYWIADILYLKGSFRDALSAVDMQNPDAYLRGESLRLAGHIYRANGLFNDAELRYHQALDLGRRNGSAAMEGKALTNLAETLSWTRPSEGREFGLAAVAANEAIDNKLELLKAHVALAVAADGINAREVAAREIQISRELAEVTGYAAGNVFASVAEAFHAALVRDTQHLTTLLGDLQDMTAKLKAYEFWCDIVRIWIEPQPTTSSVTWLRSYPELRSAWSQVLGDRKR